MNPTRDPILQPSSLVDVPCPETQRATTSSLYEAKYARKGKAQVRVIAKANRSHGKATNTCNKTESDAYLTLCYTQTML